MRAHRGGRRTGLPMAAAALLTAALALGLPSSPGGAANKPAKHSPDVSTLLYDERLALIVADVPEFGGLYVDENARRLYVLATERRPRIIADLRHAIRKAFPNEDLPHHIVLKKAQFTFDQLFRWKAKARELLAIDGVTRNDIDERMNRVTIGVTRGGLDGRVHDELVARGVPPAGWMLEEVDAQEEHGASVDDRNRPLLGGLKISMSTGGACTYGLTAIRQGVQGFITNSHCTPKRGVVEGVMFAQPSFASSTDLIGTETVDPAYFTGGDCPAGRKCAYADAIFAKFTGSGLTASRSIVRNLEGSLSWDGVSKYPVVLEGTSLLGNAVRKIGERTGHTFGKVDDTCVDVYSDNKDTGEKFTYLCQTAATYARDHGDSGAPVFNFVNCTINGVAALCAKVFGIHRSGDDTHAYYSPIANIQRAGELGPLDICQTGNC